ncbi:hypothetical protein [Granulosicoccus antarcticus]|nr:hypothetical protein [Granulosicoccus antarcticus]
MASRTACLTGERFDLRAIRQALAGLRHNMDRVNYFLDNDQVDLSRQSVDQIVQAYGMLDHYVSIELRLLALGQSREVLALNHCVLFGQENTDNLDYRKAFRANEKHFYRVGSSGIGDMLEWYSRHRNLTVWRQAAGIYLNTVGPPQLFLEGNHRTGVLLANYVLARANKSPLVLDAQLAPDWFRLTEKIRKRRGSIFDPKYWFRSLDIELADFIQANVNECYLRSDSGNRF